MEGRISSRGHCLSHRQCDARPSHAPPHRSLDDPQPASTSLEELPRRSAASPPGPHLGLSDSLVCHDHASRPYLLVCTRHFWGTEVIGSHASQAQASAIAKNNHKPGAVSQTEGLGSPNLFLAHRTSRQGRILAAAYLLWAIRKALARTPVAVSRQFAIKLSQAIYLRHLLNI